jgi:hypothetical protein
MMHYWSLAVVAILLLFASTSARAEEDARDYYAPLTATDEENIGYIITTLGTSSYVGLLFRQGKLERTGDQMGHIHPLNYMGYVYSHPELQAHARNISGIPWNKFVEGFADSFEQCLELNNLSEEHAIDFAERVGLPLAPLWNRLQNKDWKGFFEMLKQGSTATREFLSE